MGKLLTIPAPVRGWNTVDSIAQIPPDQAIVLDNMIPSTSSVVTRYGYSVHATSVGNGNVDSLFELKVASISKMIAASGGSIYDVSSAGVGASLASGFTSNQWQGTVFNGVIGLVNGVDAPQTYNGTAVAAMVVSGPSDINKLTDITTFKNRSYFVEANSQSFWYSALSALGGVLTSFPLGKVGNFGGNLIAIQTLTKDGGTGQDDVICFFMSTGEVILYNGIDPGTDFVLIGVFKAGRPVSSRAIEKFGADIMTVTNEGYLPVSSLLPLSFGKTNSEISNYIRGAASDAAATYPSSFGWQVIVSPTNNFMLVNVPQAGNAYVQHVLNVNTMAWCRFTGINARCWCTFGNDLFFGGIDGNVYKYGPNYTDNGSPIVSVYQSPYLRLTEGGSTRTTAFRPWARLDGTLTLTVKHSVDFKPYSLPYTVSYTFSGAAWGATWGSPWAVSNSTLKFLNLNNIAYCTSIYLTFSSAGAVDYFQTDFLVTPGDRL